MKNELWKKEIRKNPIYNSIKKYLGLNLTKEVQEKYSETIKHGWKTWRWHK
jgi:hypothetical protein